MIEGVFVTYPYPLYVVVVVVDEGGLGIIVDSIQYTGNSVDNTVSCD